VPVIEARSLSKRFGRLRAVDGVSFRVEPGRVTGFLGPNGAGKTTTLRMILGLVTPDRGEALIDGVPYRRLDEPMRRVGAVLEATGFHPGRRARQHLRALAVVGGLPATRVDDVLRTVGLEDAADRRVGGFSLGMRQRLALAAALLGEPGCLVLDEPANGLDPEGISWLRAFLRWYASQGRAVLVSSHLLAEMQQLADDVVVISDGRVVASGPVDGLTARLGQGVRLRSPEPERLVEVLGRAGLRVQRVEGTHDAVVVRDATPEIVGPVVARAQIVLHEMVVEAPTLEEAYLALTAGASGATASAEISMEMP
jgi:ABC-2 type transport system ATP-binding protein